MGKNGTDYYSYPKGELNRAGGERYSVDRVIATTILDRVLHHVITINIRGNSYRLEEKLKAGLVRAEEAAA